MRMEPERVGSITKGVSHETDLCGQGVEESVRYRLGCRSGRPRWDFYTQFKPVKSTKDDDNGNRFGGNGWWTGTGNDSRNTSENGKGF